MTPLLTVSFLVPCGGGQSAGGGGGGMDCGDGAGDKILLLVVVWLLFFGVFGSGVRNSSKSGNGNQSLHGPVDFFFMMMTMRRT